MSIYRFLIALLYTSLGFIIVIGTIVCVTLCSPLYLYRWIITKLVAPWFRPEIGKAVNVTGHFMAAELIQKEDKPSLSDAESTPHKCTCVVKNVFLGCITAEEISEWINDGWLNKKENGYDPMYPEFQQYLESWMGFMFWKQDKTFSLENHLHVHKIADNEEEMESELFLNNLIETMLNKRFPAKRSPWEMYLVQNYRNRGLIKNNDESEMTIVIIRFHHAMVDGFSIMYAITEGLANLPQPRIQITQPRNFGYPWCYRGDGLGKLFKKMAYLPVRTLHDIGYAGFLHRSLCGLMVTPWHVPVNKKKGKTLYVTSDMIPLSTIKLIKNQLGVSFNSVLFSCLSAGAVALFRKNGNAGVEALPIFVPLPMPNHPKKLRNHMLGTVLELNTSPSLDSVQRVKQTERILIDARHYSMVPFIWWSQGRLASSLTAPLARFACKNRCIPVIASIFSGPSEEVEIRGKRILATEASMGLQEGVTGVAFVVVSYQDHVRLSITAEDGRMKRDELIRLAQAVTREIHVLSERVLSNSY